MKIHIIQKENQASFSGVSEGFAPCKSLIFSMGSYPKAFALMLGDDDNLFLGLLLLP